jgi:DNA-binding beta-propeller fold protein YncE
VIGPTGVAFDDDSDILYIADTLNNRIVAVRNALFRSVPSRGFTVSADGGLNGPLGLSLSPNHQLIAANSGNGNLVQIDPFTRTQVGEKLVDNSGSPAGAGALFGLFATDDGIYFVDDATNTFDLLH